MKVWLLKLLSQNPFILLNSSAAIKETLEFFQEQGFTNFEILQLLSKLKVSFSALPEKYTEQYVFL